MPVEATPLLFTPVGVALSKLVDFAIDLQTRAAKFKKLLKRLQTTLELLTPVFDGIQRSEREFARIENALQELLAKGNGLLAECRDNPNLLGRSKLSNKLRKYDDEIRRFCDHLSLRNFREIINNTETLNTISMNLSKISSGAGSSSNSTPNLVSGCDVLKLSNVMVGVDRPLRQLKNMLLKGTKTMYVLSAAGGSGKTTLAEALHHDPEVKGKYGENRFFVTVKGTPVKEIVQKLLQHKKLPVPDIQSDQDVKDSLKSLLISLRPHPVLLILDDVSPDSDFPIESFMFEIPDYKVLITSRSSMFSVAGSYTYKLKLLDDENAKELFLHYAFPINGVPDFVDDDDLVGQVVKKCKNNPLILKVIAGSLASEPKVMWKSLLKDWSEKIRNSKVKQIDTLRLCVDALENKGVLKDCYDDLACFPDDIRIPAAVLTDMWVELYKLDEDKPMDNLLQLSKRNLVDMMTTRKDATEIYSCYNEIFVTQHDNLKELAINPTEQGRRLIIEIGKNHLAELPLSISTGHLHRSIWQNFLSLFLQEPAAEVRLLSISTDEEFTSNWWDMKLPGVEVLLLSLRSRHYDLPKFVETMGELRVLVIKSHGVCHAELGNFLILRSLSNLRRIRLENVSVPSIFESSIHHEPVGNMISGLLFPAWLLSFLKPYRFRAVTPMRNLKKISLVMCSIGQAFKSSSVQFCDIFPELEELDIDYCSDIVEFPPLCCYFTSLKKLSITNCPKLTKLSDEISQLEALEELNLHACSEFTELPSTISRLKHLTFLNISDCVSLTNLPETIGGLGSLEKIHMRGCTSLSELPESIKYLRNLRHVFGDEERVALWNAYKPLFDDNLQIHEVKENVNLNWLL